LKDLAGSGYCISGSGTLLREAELPLGKYITVFQAEVYAISHVASRLNQEAQDGFRINVYVDCKSALDSLTSEALQGQLVRECAARLNALASNRQLMLHWIPAHKGYSGNEFVDRLAKKAAETPFLGPEPSILISTETVNSAIDGSTTERWRARWRRSEECRQTKAVPPEISRAGRSQCLRLSRALLRILVQVVTGHCLLAKHMCTMSIINDPTCPLCKREDEDRDHFVLKCEALVDARNEVFGFPELKPEDLAHVSLPSLLKFNLKTKRFQRNQQGDSSI
jgi:ribonuclease HI